MAALALTLAPSAAQAVPSDGDSPMNGAARADDLPNPLGDAQRELRKAAVQQLLGGEATIETRGGQKVIRVKSDRAPGLKQGGDQGKDKYVLYDVNREEDIFTILSEIGDETDDRTGGDPGPLHNQIAEPDRTYDGSATDDNSTYWTDDFTSQHYTDMMFGDGESFRDFYLKQSNGRFEAKGDVSDWVKVPYEARYGSNEIPASDGYWNYVKDTLTAWYEDQKQQGKSDSEIADYLGQFDRVDRYDHDGDGNFNEPDGYIDHFQAIHAGEGEEAGGGAQGANAIWSHRWYAFSNLIGKSGPSGNLLGGVQIGDSGIWVGDYTTEPENGGLGVFAHEFGHDLGLPDLYDTAAGDNGTGFWTLMSAGSWLGHGDDSIGTTPGYMGPWEKLQLGWLDYDVAPYGEEDSYKLGPADRDGKNTPQAVAVQLPDKDVHTDYNTPHSGQYEWWSGSADDLNVTLSRSLDLTGASSSAELSAWLWYNIEEDYDFLVAEVRPAGSSQWTQVGNIIDGPAGNEEPSGWVQHTWDLGDYVGQDVDLRFRFYGDGGVHYENAFIDDIAVTADGSTVLSDDVESGADGWTANGFTRMTGATDVTSSQYYLVENRVYGGYDDTLRTGPYNFGWTDTRPDFVEHFPYQNGMLVWYVDNAYTDNNTSSHPGSGLVLPVDARPQNLVFSDGARLGNRRQVFDATFGQEATDAVSFHHNGTPLEVPSHPAMPTFDDSDPNRYWDSTNPWSSVKVAGTGTTMTVQNTGQSGDWMVVHVDSDS